MRNIIHVGAGTDGRNRFVAIALGVALAAGPAAMLPAAALAAPAAHATAASTTAANGLDTEEKAFIDKYKDTIASVLGIDGFDPSISNYYGVKESTLDTVAGKIPGVNTGLKLLGAPIEIDTNATGWLVNGKITKGKPTSGDLAYRITIRGKSGGTVAYTLHTASQDASGKADPGELKNVTATANGKPVAGFDPTKTGTWTVPDGAEVKFSGLPDGWARYKNLGAKPGTLSYDIKKGDVTVVTWTFTYDSTDKPATGADALKGVAATVDGKPLPSFDPTKSGTYRVATGAEVKISNVPSDWKLDKTESGSKLVFTASKGGTAVTWTFEYQANGGSSATDPGNGGGSDAGGDGQGGPGKTPDTSKPAASPKPAGTANDGQAAGAAPLASTGAGAGPAVALAGLLAMAGTSLLAAVARTRRHGADPDGLTAD